MDKKTATQVENEIRAILEEIRPEFDFKRSNNFIEDGMLDSFDIITLTNMLEERYSIKIDGLDIVPENYSSTADMVRLVKKSGGDF